MCRTQRWRWLRWQRSAGRAAPSRARPRLRARLKGWRKTPGLRSADGGSGGIPLQGLTAGQTVYFRVMVKDAYGNLSWSAQQAVNFAAAMVASGVHDVMIGGGVEHMGHIGFGDAFKVMEEYGMGYSPELMERYNLVPQGISAEMIADQWEIPRSELDELAVRSHANAHQATEEGRFEREIAPVQVNGDTYSTDQGIRPGTDLETLAGLKPAFKEDGKITAGNSSQISDGAAAVLLMTREKADELGLKPRAKILDQTTVGVDPVMMLTGPIPATQKLLERNSMTIDDIDLIEINEAFASVVAAWNRELQPDMDRVNVNGGAISIGHPLGSTGARLITTLLHEMERSDSETGLVTMCCGGGLGTGTLIQLTD